MTTQLSHRLSGRSLLSLGLLLVSIGLTWMALNAARFDQQAIVYGMLLAGSGAGPLNGETTKVGMTVIPPARSGMASGVSGTVRFTGVVVGSAALGAVHFGSVGRAISTAWGSADEADRADFIRAVASGHLLEGDDSRLWTAQLQKLALQAFGTGYQSLLFAAAGLTAIAALATWLLVQAADTQPTVGPAPLRRDQ